MPATMKALCVLQGREFEIQELPVPEPGPGQVLMRVDAITTCPQWDLHLRHNEPMFTGHRFHYPYTVGQPGHEAVGSIAAIGEGVTTLAVGDRVCAWRDPGHNVPGCYAQYVLRDPANLIQVPADLPDESLASLELAMCVASSVLTMKQAGAIAGARVGVMGLGPAGLIAVQMLRAEQAAEVVGFDLSTARCGLAQTLGAVEAYDPREAPADKFPARPARPALEAGIDCVGAKGSVEWLMDRTAGVVALFGVQREDYTFAVRHYSGLMLCGYRGHSLEAAQYALQQITSGAVNLAPLVSYTLPLERYADAIDLLERQEAIKVCFKPWE